jgi:hypothetical protein
MVTRRRRSEPGCRSGQGIAGLGCAQHGEVDEFLKIVASIAVRLLKGGAGDPTIQAAPRERTADACSRIHQG